MNLLPVMMLALSMATTMHPSYYQEMHGGIAVQIQGNPLKHRMEHGKNGDFTYEEPGMQVQCANGKIRINGVDAGEVGPGDHLEIDQDGIVRVNGVYRGDRSFSPVQPAVFEKAEAPKPTRR